MSWVFRDPATRPDRLERLFGVLMRHVWLPRGECLTTDDLDGAALWLAPGAGTCRWRRRPGVLPRTARAGRARDTADAARHDITEARHPRSPDTGTWPCWAWTPRRRAGASGRT